MQSNLAIDTREDPLRLLDRALEFAQEYYRKGHEGKTLIIGCGRNEAPVAFAAGLRNASQRKQLVILARYLFATHDVDRYVVFLPAWSGSGPNRREVVAVDLRTPEGRWQLIADVERDSEGRFHLLRPGEVIVSDSPLLDQLLMHGHSLPGLMRRELDLAYESLRVATPPLCTQGGMATAANA